MSRSSKAPPCCPHLPTIPSHRHCVTSPTLHISGPSLHSATLCRSILHVAPGHSRPPVHMDEALLHIGIFIRWFQSRRTCALSTLFRVHTPELIDNVVHGCLVEAIIVGVTLKFVHFLGRVCAQFSLHSLMRMRMGVGIGSGARYKVRSGDILFMESAINMYVHCCFSKWYVQLLCVHWCIVCALASPLSDLVLCHRLVFASPVHIAWLPGSWFCVVACGSAIP